MLYCRDGSSVLLCEYQLELEFYVSSKCWEREFLFVSAIKIIFWSVEQNAKISHGRPVVYIYNHKTALSTNVLRLGRKNSIKNVVQWFSGSNRVAATRQDIICNIWWCHEKWFENCLHCYGLIPLVEFCQKWQISVKINWLHLLSI